VTWFPRESDHLVLRRQLRIPADIDTGPPAGFALLGLRQHGLPDVPLSASLAFPSSHNFEWLSFIGMRWPASLYMGRECDVILYTVVNLAVLEVYYVTAVEFS